MIPIYKEKPSFEKWLASEIFNWQIRGKEYLHNHTTPILQQPQLSVPTLVSNSPTNVVTMPSNLTDIFYRPPILVTTESSVNQLAHLIVTFTDCYFPLPSAVLDLYDTFSGAWLDCG